ncbi:MAG: MtnX-like HAD-IB family phosphatase [Dehalococcoidales bacterium]|nr:MtnX-like HAD-IB family phosphatase [Dehalococcoidales bacterium]
METPDMNAPPKHKYLVQCDFDGTITNKDVSFLALDKFADGDWQALLREYQTGKIPVGTFNTKAFAMIKTDKKTLLDFILNNPELHIRPGFKELVDYCEEHRLEFVIVSNGQDFYLEAILKKLGLPHLRFFAAKSRFLPDRLQVDYIAPDGTITEEGFKDKHTEMFRRQGYRIIYIGNGVSDYSPARQADYVFATGELLQSCRENNLKCLTFEDLHEVVQGLKNLKLD